MISMSSCVFTINIKESKFNYNFRSEANPVNLNVLVVVTADLSCSASEPMLAVPRYLVDNQTCQIVAKVQFGPSTAPQGLQAIFGAV